MPCQRGQELHTELVNAVAARIKAEGLPHLDMKGELRLAQQREDMALWNRSMHVARCADCWQRQPC